jgi:hypothetical protein
MMRAVNGLHLLVVSAILCGMVHTAAGQSSAKAEVLAALAERDKAFVAGDETKLAQLMSEDYLQTDVSGHVQDKQAWLKEYYRPLALLLKSGETQCATFDRGISWYATLVTRWSLPESRRSSTQASIRGIQKPPFSPVRLGSSDSLMCG